MTLQRPRAHPEPEGGRKGEHAMAYAARQQGAERFTSIGAVLLIHAVLAIVIIKQITPGLIPRIVPPRFMPPFEVQPPPKPAEPPPTHPTAAERNTTISQLPIIYVIPTNTTKKKEPHPHVPPTYGGSTVVDPAAGSGLQ